MGRQIALRANFFKVRLPQGVIHHYDLSILPDKCPRRVNRDVVEAMVSSYHKIFETQKPVFDGRKNLYSRTPLPIGKKPVRFRLEQRCFVSPFVINVPIRDLLFPQTKKKIRVSGYPTVPKFWLPTLKFLEQQFNLSEPIMENLVFATKEPPFGMTLMRQSNNLVYVDSKRKSKAK